MAKNYIQEGRILPFVAGAEVASGELVVAGGLVGVSLKDVATGGLGQMQRDGVWKLTGATGAINYGDPLYLNNQGNVTPTNTGSYPHVGYALSTKASGATGAVNVLIAQAEVVHTPLVIDPAPTLFPFTASGAVTAGDVIVVGDLVGVAATDVDNDDDGQMYIAGQFTLKADADTITAGDKLYWHTTNGATTTAAGAKALGWAMAASVEGTGAATGTYTVLVMLGR